LFWNGCILGGWVVRYWALGPSAKSLGNPAVGEKHPWIVSDFG
jgi:hypothetical protein